MKIWYMASFIHPFKNSSLTYTHVTRASSSLAQLGTVALTYIISFEMWLKMIDCYCCLYEHICNRLCTRTFPPLFDILHSHIRFDLIRFVLSWHNWALFEISSFLFFSFLFFPFTMNNAGDVYSEIKKKKNFQRIETFFSQWQISALCEQHVIHLWMPPHRGLFT